MNKIEFLKSLGSALAKLPVSEREDILRDYEEHFLIGQEHGKSEEQIAESLGVPKQIAKELITTYAIEQVESKPNVGNVFRAVMAGLALGFFNAIFVLGILGGIVGVLVGGWAAGVGTSLSLFAYVIGNLISGESFTLFEFFASILASGLGIFLLLAMFAVTKWFIRMFIRYLKANISIVKRGYNND